METVYASLQSTSFSLSNRLCPVRAKLISSWVSFVSYPYCNRNLRRTPSLSFKNKDSSLLFEPYRLQKSSLEAVVSDAAAIPNDCSAGHLPFPNQSDQTVFHEGSTAKDSESGDEKGDTDYLDDHTMVKVCDKLIEVFMVDKPTPSDWRRLLAFSKTWSNIRSHFFQRCQIRADAEDDPALKHKLLRLGRKMKEVDEDVQRHNELIEVIRRAPAEISEVVAKRRKDFTKEFFEHLHTVAQSYHEDPNEQTAMEKLVTMALDAVQAYDTSSESMEALNAAELKLQDIVNSPSLDAACRKIDNLAKKNQLDSTTMLMITKAWSAAKESNLTKDEAKDMLYHLYMTARGNLQRLMPKEVRILKYLITIEDPEQRISNLNDAFTPGVELEGEDVDSLYTTPEKLHTWICTIVDAYYSSQEGTLLREARDMLNPKVIQRLKEVKKVIQDKFM